MPTIDVDETTVHLRPQKRPAFEEITALVFEEPNDDRMTDLLYAQHVAALRRAGRDLDDPAVQAGLWAMHDLGARRVRLENEVEILERIDAAAARGEASCFGFAAVRDGRAFSAAIANVRNRTMRLNGETRVIQRNPRERIEPVMQLISQNRLVDEDLLITTVRVLVTLFEQPKTDEMDAHIEAALEIATDLGVEGLAIDTDSSIEIDRLNVGNALASAVLQGLEPDDVMAIRKRLEEINAQSDARNQSAG
jgi:hypothetical protein